MSGTSAGGQGGADAAQGTQTGDGAAAAGAAQGGDMTAVLDQLSQMQSGQEELRSFVTGLQAQQQDTGAQETGDDSLDLSFLDDPMQTPEQIAQQMGDLLKQTTSSEVQALVAPLAQKLDSLSTTISEDQMAREFDALVTEFPEIGEQETMREVLGTAGQLAQQLGQPDLSTNPKFLRLVFTSGRAFDAAQSEGSAPGAAVLEGGGGAIPGGSGPDMASTILGANKGRGALPF